MDGIIQFVKNLGTVRLIVFGTLLAILGFILFAAAGNISSGPMTVLYTGLDNESKNNIIASLSAQGIAYQDGGPGAISVPQNLAPQLRMQFAEQGSSGTIPGYENLFPTDDGPFGQTSTVINLNIKRALEGELARTFKTLKGVSNARVLIAMPKKRAFGQSEEPSASVTISPSSGGISSSQAQAIQAIASASVPGLSPDRVTVADTSGRLLAGSTGKQGMSGMNSIEESRQAKERMFQDRIETQLERVVGLGRVQANVTVEMTTDRVTEQVTEFNPDGQVIASQSITEEQSSQSSGEGGETSVSTTTPGGDGAAGGAGNGDQTSKLNEITKFDNSKTVRNIIKEPGTITKISVSVLVDHQREVVEGVIQDPVPWGDEQLENFKELVKNSIPSDKIEEEDIVVKQMKFAIEPENDMAAEEFKILGLFTKEDIQPILMIFIYGVLGILLVLVVLRPIAMRLVEAIPDKIDQPEPEQLEDKATMSTPIMISADGQPISKEVIEAAASGDEEATRAVLDARQTGQIIDDNMGIEAKINVAQVEGRIQESAMKKVAEIIASNPEESTAIVRSWLYED